MTEIQFPRKLVPDESTRAGRMLAAGDVRITVTDVDTDEYITVRFKAILDNREVSGARPEPSEDKNWIRAELVRATHVFIEVPSAGGTYPDKIGTFYPRTGRFFPDNAADPARVKAAVLSALWLNGGYEKLEETVGDDAEQYDLEEESYCGKCGRQLTNPDSIERGIGPECLGAATNAEHQVKVKHVRDMTDDDWAKVQGSGWPFTVEPNHPKHVNELLSHIASLNEKQIERVRRELNMWHSQERPSGLFDR